ncbi:MULTISPECIES: hypothetical protein [Metallosphaera]|uniref:hypothetical protein n=1 Tax=Metallosphaera TaxID=41980 RepID=UPI002989B0DA|nr:hypothetical protein [Metallosphaera sedula]MCP6728442.1 hypothetical protein [Metallosphaera sedula]
MDYQDLRPELHLRPGPSTWTWTSLGLDLPDLLRTIRTSSAALPDPIWIDLLRTSSGPGLPKQRLAFSCGSSGLWTWPI